MKSAKKVLVVGAGFFGLTVAERIANVIGAEVHIIDCRNHVGGNAHSYNDSKSGIEVHKYGIHIFHTSNPKVWDYVNYFTAFNNYRHQVFSVHNDKAYPMPISLATITQFYQKHMTPDEAIQKLVESGYGSIISPKNLEEKAVTAFGSELYNALIREYTTKQWQVPPKELPADIVGRLPLRLTFDTGYFDDTYQGMPVEGYFGWHQKMLENPLIKLDLGVPRSLFKTIKGNYDITIFTGPLDEYFDSHFGPLSWRTLDFEHETLETKNFQGVAQLNYADVDAPYTRVLEFRHLHPERKYDSPYSAIAREYSRWAQSDDEKYYPVRTKEDMAKLHLYRKLAAEERDVFFGGRLGSYLYLDMHMAISSALTLFETKLQPRLK